MEKRITVKADKYNVDDFSSSTSPMRGHVGLTESVWGKIRSRRSSNNCAKLCRHPLLTMVVLVMVAVEDIWIIAAGQSRAAAGPNLILNFLPRCSNAVNSGVAIRGQGADQGNIKFDSITNSKVPISSHPSTEKRAGEAERKWLFCHFFCTSHQIPKPFSTIPKRLMLQGQVSISCEKRRTLESRLLSEHY